MEPEPVNCAYTETYTHTHTHTQTRKDCTTGKTPKNGGPSASLGADMATQSSWEQETIPGLGMGHCTQPGHIAMTGM